MSAFAAIIDLLPESPQEASTDLNQMLSTMKRRGADAEFRIHTGSCVLGGLGREPNMRQDQCLFQQQEILLAGDLRLDQRSLLREKLGLDSGVGDAEMLLTAYRRYGESMVAHLSGDFAFVITDGQSVFCARDHLGVKPLYYYFSGRRLVLASEARAVQSAVHSELNHQRIADFLVYPLEHVDHSTTFYRGIYRLPPASRLVVRNGHLRLNAYWQPGSEDQLQFKSDDDYSTAFRTLFASAVADRIDPNANGVAAMLSGGVDSSTIVGFANAVKPVTTFSTVEFEDQCVETDYIRRTQKHLGQSAVMVTSDDAREVIGEVFTAVKDLGEPFDYYMIQSMLLNHAAAKRGFSYLLDGLEGDMLHSLSINYPAGLMREGKVRAGLAEVYYVWKNAFGRDTPLPIAYYQAIRQIGIPDSLGWLRRVRRRLARQEDELVGSLISRAFAAEHHVLSRLHAASVNHYGVGRTLQQQHEANVVHPAISAATERYDRVAGMFGIEPRHPLMDKRLVEFSLCLPREQKTFQGWSKYHLRRIGEGVIPHEVSWRVGRDENAWRFIDVLSATCGDEMRAQILDERDILMPYIEPVHLLQLRDDDLLELFGLLSWLKREARV